MFKLLTFIVLGYLAYKVFFKPSGNLDKAKQTPLQNNNKNTTASSSSSSNTEGEYIDYEEVDD